jgi:hypothetical protein
MLGGDSGCTVSRTVGAAWMSPSDVEVDIAVRTALQPDRVSCELDAARVAWNLRRDRCLLRRLLVAIVMGLKDDV